jgi:hypothetical protein
MDNYRVEVDYWYRDNQGEWDLSDYWLNFETLEEAMLHVKVPRGSEKDLISVKLYDMREEYKVSESTLVYHKVYHPDSVILELNNG